MKTSAATVAKTLRDKSAIAREIALRELKILQKDLGLLERILSGSRKAGEFSLFDVVHGAFEIFRTASVVLENEALLADLEKETAKGAALEFLEKRGATLLTKPAGWHWISPRGEMRFLGKAAETEKAAEALRALLPGGRRAKSRPADTALPEVPEASEATGTA